MIIQGLPGIVLQLILLSLLTGDGMRPMEQLSILTITPPMASLEAEFGNISLFGVNYTRKVIEGIKSGGNRGCAADRIRHGLLLTLILLLASLVALIPRLDYPYPMHVDEWSQLTYCRVASETGHIAFQYPSL